MSVLTLTQLYKYVTMKSCTGAQRNYSILVGKVEVVKKLINCY